MRRFALLVLGVVALVVGSLYVRHLVTDEPAPEPSPPSQVDKVITFCSVPANRDNPLCKVDPHDPDAVRDAVRDAIARQTQGPQVIERERITDRVGDHSDSDSDSDARNTRVIPPPPSPARTQTPRPTPRPTTQRPPLMPDLQIPELPPVPQVKPPSVQLPPLPLP